LGFGTVALLQRRGQAVSGPPAISIPFAAALGLAREERDRAMDRQELLAVRIEFEKLANLPQKVDAQHNKLAGQPHFWWLRGGFKPSRDLFTGLALRAARAMALCEAEPGDDLLAIRGPMAAWLDKLLDRNGLEDTFEGIDSETKAKQYHGYLNNVAWLSVLEIDKLLAAPETTSNAAKTQEEVLSDVDESAFVSASTLWHDRFITYKRFSSWLQRNSSKIRTRKPRKNRLEIHSGDWLNHWARVEVENVRALDEAGDELAALHATRKNNIPKNPSRKQRSFP
jgi:hypothetical protein